MRLLVCDPLEKEVIAKLKEKFEVTEGYNLDENALAERVKDVDIVIVRSKTRITRRVIEAGEKLKMIGRPGVGLDTIDVKAANERGIKVLNTPEAPAASVAELVFGLMLCLARKITLADGGMKNGKWLKTETKGRELFGKTIGLVGFGNIGSHIAKIATAAGMNVVAYDKYRKDSGAPGVSLVSLEELLETSDFVSLHVPLTDETRQMISGERIAMMKQSAFLINTSRGGVVDEEALYKALSGKKIAGAGLDVFSTEPYSGPLTKLDNVVLTPHIGASTDEAQVRSGMMLAEKIAKEAGV